MSVFQIISIEAAEGKAEELLSMLRQARDFTLTVQGCEAYEVYQGRGNPRKFVIVERWTSTNEHEAHFQKNVIESGVMDRVMAIAAQPPQFDYYDVR